MLDPEQAEHPRVKSVMLALNLARHSANNWENAALPDDYKEIGLLLRMKPEDVQAMVMPREDVPTGAA